MKVKATQFCRCGHRAASHTLNVFAICDDTEVSDLETGQKGSLANHSCPSNCRKFELQNLDLIEYLAEKRGLI